MLRMMLLRLLINSLYKWRAYLLLVNLMRDKAKRAPGANVEFLSGVKVHTTYHA